MALFRYEVMDRQGRTMNGAINASTEGEARQRLLTQGYVVRQITAAGGTRPPAVQASSPVRPAKTYWTSASGSELALFFRSLASYLRAGINPFQALHNAANQTNSGGIQRIAGRMAEHVQSGGKLSDVMREFPRAFPEHIVGVIAAGELGGFLPVVAGEIASDYELAQRASNRTAGIISFLLWVNTFGTLLLAPFLRIGLRGLAEAMAQSSEGETIVQYLPMILGPYGRLFMTRLLPGLIILVGGYYLVRAILRLPAYRPLAHRLLLYVPVAGNASRERSLAAFCGMLWRLQQAGVPYVTAWSAAALAPENAVISRALVNQVGAVRSGAKLSAAIAATGLFPHDDYQQMSIAENTGVVPEALERMAGFYKDSAQVSAGRVRWLGLRTAIIFTLLSGGFLAYEFIQFYGDILDPRFIDKLVDPEGFVTLRGFWR